MMETAELFEHIKPLCLRVVENTDINSVKMLEYFIDSVRVKENEWISCLSDFTEYISFPLLVILKKETFGTGTQDFLETILRCLNKVYEVSREIQWKFFSDSFTLLFKHLASYDDPSKLGTNNEECKLEALQAISHLCKGLDPKYHNNICSECFRPQLGHAIFICLQIAEKDKNKKLKIVSLETIQSLGLKEHEDYFIKSFKQNLSSAFSNFLPGITIATTRIATGEEIQGHKIAVAALQCWEYFVILVMRDEFLKSFVSNLGISKTYYELKKKLYPNIKEDDFQLPKINSKQVDNESESNLKLKMVIINQDWIEGTAENLHILTNRFTSLVSHSHYKVRLTLVKVAKNILFYCGSSLSKCIDHCIDILITLSNDQIVEVNQHASDALHQYKGKLNQSESENLLKAMEEKIFYITSRLPTIIRTQDDVKSLSTIRHLYGTLELIDNEGVSKLVKLPIYLQRLLRSFIVVLTYDISDSDLLLERMISEDPFEIISVKPELGRNFRYFQSKSIFEVTAQCCQLLGAQSNLMLIVDYCLDFAQESCLTRSEVYLILAFIMKGASQNRDNIYIETKEKIVSAIIDAINCQRLFELPLAVSQAKTNNEENSKSLIQYQSLKSTGSVSVAKNNVILVSNLLLICGFSALFLGEDFKVFMSDILCTILEKAGDKNVLVSYSSSLALQNIVTACQYSNVSHMVEDTVPLFWFSLSQKLKNLPDYPSCPQVLKFVLKCNKKEFAHFIEDLVDDILDSMDMFHSESAVPLLTVLLAYVEALNANSKETLPKIIKPCDKIQEETLLDFVRNLDASDKTLEASMEVEEAVNLVDDNEGFTEYCEDIDEQPEDNKVEVPRNVKYIVRILEKCSYLLFVKDRQSQLLILQIIKSSALVLLNDWENEKLPVYHKLWKPLILRLKDKDFVVLLKALETCVIMVNTSGTFLRKRCLQELFPNLLFFLRSQSSASLAKTEKSGYYLTPAYKAQKWTLQQLPNLILGLELGVMENIELLEVLLLYLDEQQPPSFLNLTVDIINIIKFNYPDLVWLTLNLVMAPSIFRSSSSKLLTTKIPGKKRNDLHPKVFEIYNELQYK